MRRVAIVVKYFPPYPRISGIVGYLSVLARRLAASGIDVHVVTAAEHAGDVAIIQWDGCVVHRVSGAFPIRAGREVRRIRPDATIVVNGIYELARAAVYWGAFDAASLGAGGRRWFFQATNVERPPPLALRTALRRYDGVLAASDKIRSQFADAVPGVVPLLPAVDLEQLATVTRESMRARARVGFVNHVNRVKGADLALAAMERLAAESAESGQAGAVDFVVAGTGELLAELQARHRSERIEWRGFLEERERLALIASCDVMLLPFRTDVSVLGVSQTVLEVQALGNIAIGTATAAITPAITDGVDGLLVAGESVEALVAAARSVLDDAAGRAVIGAAARERIGREFAIADRVAQLRALFG